ncbi:MAG: DUF2490 domain-containing protein [Flavobacteriaceae bacterium]|jgi:hypothetical protein|nr:DUF2490 domain-containing protein [Flavobacteriaceae bacterium]MBT3920268.1 DUF2490 domain-containing protein [Flavobacteriaceae bacterium]MBT6704998.1 DUF2490 domain-containing protein [Flavobacteriaceae bacterium]MBT7242187.1 DUF2490 domain-containing protein [Flavobacteriaceae bacterium]
MNLINKLARNSIFLLFLVPIMSYSQEDKVGNWLMYFGTNRISDNFSIHAEIQFRNYTITPNNVEQLLLRVGLNYHFSEKAIATAGYAYIPSYVYESEQNSQEFEEHRIWQQFILTNKLGRIKFEHRYRVEQRWVNQDYKNRLRYRLMLFVPLNKPVIEKGTLFLGFYDEIFINIKESFFDRNRLYGALGYQINKDISIQTGILHQQLSNSGKWYLQFALFFNTDFRKNPC